MSRLLVALVLLHSLVTAPVSAQETRFGVAAGPALWIELADERCEVESDTVACQRLFVDAFVGGRARFDIEALRWLRVGVQLGLGASLDGTGRAGSGGFRETQRAWFVPMGAHAYAHLDHGRVSWWIGPELFYTLRLDQLTRREFRGAPERVRTDARSGFMLGLALGVDVRLVSRFWLGFELAQALAFSDTQRLPNPVPDGKLSAMTRLGVLLRVAF
jgi:hypothetical protein